MTCSNFWSISQWNHLSYLIEIEFSVLQFAHIASCHFTRHCSDESFLMLTIFSHLSDSPDSYVNTLVSSFWAFTSPGLTTPAFSASAHMRDTPVLMISCPCIGLSPAYPCLFCTEEPRSGSIPHMDSPRLYREEGPPLSACWQQVFPSSAEWHWPPLPQGHITGSCLAFICQDLQHILLSKAAHLPAYELVHRTDYSSPSAGLHISCY